MFVLDSALLFQLSQSPNAHLEADKRHFHLPLSVVACLADCFISVTDNPALLAEDDHLE